MLFRRRKPADFREKLRLALWPRRSFARSARYFAKRVLRLRATPHAIAAGVAAGVFASFFPVGLHLVFALAVAWLVAGNLVAAALGTAVGNPLTLPVMWSASYEVGSMILNGGEPGAIRPGHIAAMVESSGVLALWRPLLEPLLVGAVPLGLAFGAVTYVITRWTVAMVQARRHARRAQAGGRGATAAFS